MTVMQESAEAKSAASAKARAERRAAVEARALVEPEPKPQVTARRNTTPRLRKVVPKLADDDDAGDSRQWSDRLYRDASRRRAKAAAPPPREPGPRVEEAARQATLSRLHVDAERRRERKAERRAKAEAEQCI